MLSCFVGQLQFCHDLERFFPTRLPRLKLSSQASIVFIFHKGIKIYFELYLSQIYHSWALNGSCPPTEGEFSIDAMQPMSLSCR